MLIKSIATVALAAALAAALLSPAFAARHHAKKPAGACGSPVGRCISDCDALSLVPDVYMRRRGIDAGAVLALLRAERALPGAALLNHDPIRLNRIMV